MSKTAKGSIASPGRETPRRQRDYTRWRVATLVLVHVLAGIHIAHWRITGKTLAPLELNEVLYTLELGIVTAGFLFMVTVVCATAVFGRFFCSWGCHILALQDLSAWILRKLRLRPKPIRSRALLCVPAIAAGYMFAWPQILRLWQGRPWVELRVATDADGWASFTTQNFWRNLPQPGITALTFFVVGFLVIYVLGSRSFCRYGCPYGAIFGVVDRIALGRIRLVKDCAQCGVCTAVCQSNVRVHEELQRFGAVVNPACLKDLDCVAACPNEAVRYAFGRPALGAVPYRDVRVRKQYDFSWPQECLMALIFVAVLLVYRGLYDKIPFLLTLGLAGTASYSGIVCVRLMSEANVSFNRTPVKRQGRLTRVGVVFVAVMLGCGALTIHSGLIRYDTYRGRSLAASVLARAATESTANTAPTQLADSAAGLHHLRRAIDWGFWPTESVERPLVELYHRQAHWKEAEALLRGRLRRHQQDHWTLEQLGVSLAGQGRLGEAIEHGRRALLEASECPDLQYRVGGWYFRTGDREAACRHLGEAIRLRPEFAEAQYDLGALQMEMGEVAAGMDHLRRAIEIRPGFADAHYNLAVGLAVVGRHDEARRHAARAAALKPDDSQIAALYAMLHEAPKP
ncbi:MAG: 4Fe-4S binding protein [Phycisphaerales bacterium]|nr:4Fe-4S binding protein [Phycisphaerales bacterium]